MYTIRFNSKICWILPTGCICEFHMILRLKNSFLHKLHNHYVFVIEVWCVFSEVGNVFLSTI